MAEVTQPAPDERLVIQLRAEVDDLKRQLVDAQATIRRLLNAGELSHRGAINVGPPLKSPERTIYGILRNARVLVFTQDSSLRYTWFFNPQDPGPRSGQSFLGKSDTDIFSEDTAQQLTSLKRHVMETGQGTRREVTMQTPEGEWTYELTLEPVRDAAGAVMGVSGTAMDVTDRRLADREIRLLAQTVASTRDAVLLADLTGALMFVNDSFLQMFGFNEEDVIGKDISIAGAPVPGTPAREQIDRATLEGGWHGEALGITNGGATLPLDVWMSVVRNDTDDPVALVAVARDLSAMKQAERVQTATYRIAAAVSTSAHLQDLYRAIHEIIGELMPARNLYIAVLDESVQMLTFPYFVDEVDQRPVARPPSKGLTEYVISTGQSLLASPEVFQDLVNRGAVESLGAPSLDWLGVPLTAGSKVLGALVVQSYSEGVRFRNEHREILTFVSTQIAMAIQRKKAEEALRESEARLQTVFESLPFDLWVCDRDGRYTMQNPVSIARWGNQIGKRSSEAGLPPDVMHRWEENNRRAFAGEMVAGEEQYTDNGKTVHLINIVTPIQRDGMILGILGLNIDITDRKMLQQQLLQAQKLESIGTLAGGIAHDFNNILGIIMGHTSLLPEAARDAARLSRSIAAIQKAGKRGAALVRQILTFARKADVKFESVNVNDVVTELGRMLQETFPRTVSISLDLDRNLPFIEADRTQVHQTLLNLCVNARDAMPEGGTLSISTRIAAPAEIVGYRSGSYVCLAVADTGMGMDDATQRRIFEPFFTTKELGKGTGLGLSVVYGIMESHRGFITLDSTPGKGTCFRLYFPAPTYALEEIPASMTHPAAVQGGNETLLIVEDEEMLCELLKTSLESAGYTVLAASDGEQAVSIYQSLADDIALVITDIGLPRMSGRDVFLRLCSIRPNVKVIIATGYIDAETRTRFLSLGAAGFLQKPYLPDEVARSVREALKTTVSSPS